MGILEYGMSKAFSGGWAWLAARLGISGPASAAVGFYKFVEVADKQSMAIGAKTEAVPENSEVKKLLDNLVRYSSGFGSYFKDYCYYEADYLAAARKDLLAGKGNLALIRLKRTYHASGISYDAREGSLYLIVTRALALGGTEDFEVVTSITITGNTASEEASSEFIRKFLEAYVPYAEARRQRIQAMQGNSRFGSQMMQ